MARGAMGFFPYGAAGSLAGSSFSIVCVNAQALCQFFMTLVSDFFDKNFQTRCYACDEK